MMPKSKWQVLRTDTNVPDAINSFFMNKSQSNYLVSAKTFSMISISMFFGCFALYSVNWIRKFRVYRITSS